MYEVLPEELALRGYGWATIRARWPAFVATLTITILFCLSSAFISVFQTLSAFIVGVDPAGISFAPQGTDPVVYLVQIASFGLALIAARRLPVHGALFGAAAFHLVHLTMNRVILGGLGWLSSGVHVTFVEPDAIALVVVHIAVCGAGFILIRKLVERHAQ